MFGCNNDRLFPDKYTVKDHISNTELEKGDHYNLILRKLYLSKALKDVSIFALQALFFETVNPLYQSKFKTGLYARNGWQVLLDLYELQHRELSFVLANKTGFSFGRNFATIIHF